MRPINPFNPYFPAQEALFANRRREQSLFRRGLDATVAPGSPGPWNVAVVGPWGIGKTSLLRRFAGMARTAAPTVGVVSLTVTSSLRSFDGFVAFLLDRTREQLRGQTRWSEPVQRELARWEPAVHLGPLSAARRSDPPSLGAATLYSELRRLWRSHAAHNLAAVAFFLDDIHNLLAVDPGLLLTIRAIFQDLQGDGAVFPLVVTGSEDMFEAARDVAEPVTRFFERVPLGPFSVEDTAAAVRDPLEAVHHDLRVEEDAVPWIWERAGGYPYFVAFIMREAVDVAVDGGYGRIDGRLLEREWPAIARQMAVEKFSVEWNSATAAEKDALRAVVSGAPLADAVGRSGAALASRLVRKGLLVRLGRGAYSAYHPLFAEYVRGAVE